MNPRQQGDWGELSAALWLTGQGAIVSRPIGHCRDYDLIADFGDRIVRVEVKSSCRQTYLGRWEVAICTRGGNQSWSGVTKRFQAERCDYVFVLVGDGRQWFLPSVAIEATTSLRLGGPKYSEYEVARGIPITPQTIPEGTSTIASS